MNDSEIDELAARNQGPLRLALANIDGEIVKYVDADEAEEIVRALAAATERSRVDTAKGSV